MLMAEQIVASEVACTVDGKLQLSLGNIDKLPAHAMEGAVQRELELEQSRLHIRETKPVVWLHRQVDGTPQVDMAGRTCVQTRPAGHESVNLPPPQGL